MASYERRQLEHKLLETVEKAHKQYQRLSGECSELTAEMSQINSDDGWFAVRKASERERNALNDYRQALKTFTDLVVHNRYPASDESAQNEETKERMHS
jgi:cell division protein FtsB